jgi:hypothetical protein
MGVSVVVNELETDHQVVSAAKYLGLLKVWLTSRLDKFQEG